VPKDQFDSLHLRKLIDKELCYDQVDKVLHQSVAFT